jgi:hypothetical protein
MIWLKMCLQWVFFCKGLGAIRAKIDPTSDVDKTTTTTLLINSWSWHDCESGINKITNGKRRLYVKGTPDSYDEQF